VRNPRREDPNYTRSRADEEQDTDWTMVGTLNSVIANTRVNVLKFSYTHEDVFFGNPGYFQKGDQAALGSLLVHQTFEDRIATRANRRMDPAYQADDTFSWFLPGRKGDHDVKFGASVYYLPLHVFDAGSQNGEFRFSTSDRDFNGARGPDFSILSMRTAYRFKLPGGGNRRVMAYVDIFNLTNRANFNNPATNGAADIRDAANFLIVRSIRNGGPSRTAQFNVRYDF